ncbi:MAG: hypothetical protein FWD80_01695 [Propionibacteriaceae bacterium]|nr:hypothetical protein [Propionibacteriaceae bacterium]
MNQIGETFGLTRERIRQIENVTLASTRATLLSSRNPDFAAAEAKIVAALEDMGRAAHVDELTMRLMGDDSTESRGIVTLLSELSPKVVVAPGNSAYYPAVVLSNTKDRRAVRADVDKLVAALKKHGKPVTLEELPKLVKGYSYPQEAAAIASLSRSIVKRDGQWGLPQWSAINPHNIRDRIYIVLSHAGKPMHFTAIADAVNAGSFRDTVYSEKVVHNGLIKDPRFVLIGRGIYALAEWGYQRGSIADIITQVLRNQSPLSSDEIVRRVLQVRQLSDRTIRLNLHTKPQFKRVAKAQYALDEKAIAVTSV